MNNIIIRGLNSSNILYLLRGFGEGVEAVSTDPGSYKVDRKHPIFSVLRDLKVKKLYWKVEETIPKIILASIGGDKQSIPVKVIILKSDNVESKVLIARPSTECIKSKMKIAHPKVEFVENKGPISINQKEFILNCLNIYDKVEWAEIKPAAIYSLNKELEVAPLNNLKIVKTKKLEITGK